jgi:hypothetical protein
VWSADAEIEEHRFAVLFAQRSDIRAELGENRATVHYARRFGNADGYPVRPRVPRSRTLPGDDP